MRTRIFLTVLWLLETGVSYATQTLLCIGSGVGDNSSNLYRIDAYGSMPSAVNIGEAGTVLTDIGVDPTTAQIYGVYNGSWYAINATNGQATAIGSMGMGWPTGLDFDRSGNAFACDYYDSRLYRVNKATGLASPVGGTGFTGLADLAFDGDGTLYGTTSSSLIRINPTTGTGTLIGAFGVVNVWGLEIDIDGTMYATVGAWQSGQATIYRVNKSTGQASSLGNITGAATFGAYGLAFTLPASEGSFRLRQITSRTGGGPCTDCCGIDHRQPILSPDGSRFVFSSIWNVDDYTGNLNPERNRELFSFLIASNRFEQLTLTTNGMSLPYSFQAGKIGFVSCSPQFGSNADTNADVFGYDFASQTVTQWVNTVGPAPLELGTNCPYTWFTASNWVTLPNLHVDLAADQRRIVWVSTRNIPSVGAPGGNNADGNYEIYWKDVLVGEVRQLTATSGGDNVSSVAGADLWPRVSADGARVVFVSNRDLGGSPVSSNRYGLFLADTNGTIQRLTTAELEVARESPAFGMDRAGHRVVFASDADLTGLNTNRNREVFGLDLDTSAITQITQTGNGVTNSRPVLSGDGLKVAFVSNGNLNGSAGSGVEQLWVYHFDADLAYADAFVPVTSLTSNQPAAEGRLSWADWYSLDHTGSNLVFTCNADLVGSNTGHAYEIFLASFEWQPFRCDIARVGTNQYRLSWSAGGSGAYTVESCSSLVNAAWLPVSPTNQWPTTATTWTNSLSPGEPVRFFRVRVN